LSDLPVDPKQLVTDAKQEVADVAAGVSTVLSDTVTAVRQLTDAVIAANQVVTNATAKLESVADNLQTALDNWPDNSNVTVSNLSLAVDDADVKPGDAHNITQNYQVTRTGGEDHDVNGVVAIQGVPPGAFAAPGEAAKPFTLRTGEDATSVQVTYSPNPMKGNDVHGTAQVGNLRPSNSKIVTPALQIIVRGAAIVGNGKGWVGSKGYSNPSALGWFSGLTPQAGNGVADQIPALNAFRGGRPIDSMTLFQGGAHRHSWPDEVATWKPGSSFQVGHDGPKLGAHNVRAIVTVPFLNDSVAHDWAGLAAGKYNDFIRQIAVYVKGYNLPLPILVRPCREFNDTGQPFGAETDRPNGFRNFKRGMINGCMQFADVFGRNNVLFTACVTKRGFQTLKDGWWDDQWIDIIDIDLYKTKSEPSNSDPSNWVLYKRFIDDFVGLATAKRKPIGFSEWGYHNQGGDAFAPLWFETFFRWLDGNKIDVSHENYYNADNHVIFNPGGGTVDVPAGQRTYKQLWGK
jgi:hypothetical protein